MLLDIGRSFIRIRAILEQDLQAQTDQLSEKIAQY